jgi:hypothetical protein
MNAAERLWRGIAHGDWAAVRAQFHAAAVVERFGGGWVGGPESNVRLSVEELVAAHRVEAARGAPAIEVLRSLSDGTACVIEARVGDARCAGIYDLHEGRIAGAVEYWA